MNIPERLKLRPTFRGFPVPYTALILPDGTPDLRTIDIEKWLIVVKKKLCGLCGQRLGMKCYFIGGEECEKHRHFADPAMHKDCVEYAFTVCPFLAVESKTYSKRPINFPHLVDDGAAPAAPSLAIFETTRYSLVSVDPLRIRAAPWLSVVWKRRAA